MRGPLPGGSRRPRYAVAVLILLAIVRWWLGTTPGYPPDIGAYKRWAIWGGTKGVTALYDKESLYDYPPLYGYLLSPLGSLVTLFAPNYAAAYLDSDPARRPGYSALFSLLVKLPPLAFDVLMALLLARLVRDQGLWPPQRSRRGWNPALLYLCHPAVLFVSGYWGQPDVIETYFVMLAMALMLQRKPEAGWVAAALALLMKPLAAPFFPLLALLTWVRSGWRRLLTGGLAAGTTILAGLAPFMMAGRGPDVAQRLFTDIDLMPYTSVNAHNLWWLLGPWKPANAQWIGPLTPKTIGLGLFAIAYAAVLWWVWRRDRVAARGGPAAAPASGEVSLGADPSGADHIWYLAAAATAFAFFTLSTHMHENHLFPALPFLVLVAGRDRRWAWMLGAAGFVLLVNAFTHDVNTGMAWLGPLGPPSGFFHPDFQRHLSRWEFWLATGNAIVTVASCALFFWWLRSPVPGPGSPPSSAR